MSNPMDVIKEYLVNLGFSVDNNQFNRVNQVIKDLSRTVESHTSGMAKDYVKAGGIITSVLVSVTTATAGLMERIAQADLGYQKFAMRMYMARDAAKELKIVTDAMGESLEDIAWIPELRQRYFTLMGEARRMEPGAGFGSEMKYLRDIRFEFTRMKVEAVYGLQWIGHNIFKYLNGGLRETKEYLSGINDWIQGHMPEWTDKAARFLMVMMQLGKDTLRFVKDLAPALAVVGAYFVATSPLGRSLAIMSGLLLLLDDFYAYVDGRKSSQTLAPVWYLLVNVGKELKDTLGNVRDLMNGLVDVSFEGMNKKLRWSVYSLGLIAGSFSTFANLIVNSALAIKNAGSGNFSKAWEDLNRPLISTEYLQALANIAPTKDQEIVRAKAPTRDQMWAEAQRVGRMTGIAPLHIFSQWFHESAGFSYPGAVERNNFGGIRSGGEYRSFGTLDEFANFYAGLMTSKKYRDAGVLKARNLGEFTAALKRGGYYEDSYQNYYNGMVSASQFAPRGTGGAGMTVNTGGVNINITNPNASPEDIKAAVFKGMEDANRAMWARQIHEFQGVNP